VFAVVNLTEMKNHY